MGVNVYFNILQFYSFSRRGRKREKEEGFAPSLKSISKAYKNKKENLLKYLKGEAKAIIDPDREDFMKPYIKQTKSLENKDLENLADFLLSF